MGLGCEESDGIFTFLGDLDPNKLNNVQIFKRFVTLSKIPRFLTLIMMIYSQQIIRPFLQSHRIAGSAKCPTFASAQP